VGGPLRLTSYLFPSVDEHNQPMPVQYPSFFALRVRFATFLLSSLQSVDRSSGLSVRVRQIAVLVFTTWLLLFGIHLLVLVIPRTCSHSPPHASCVTQSGHSCSDDGPSPVRYHRSGRGVRLLHHCPRICSGAHSCYSDPSILASSLFHRHSTSSVTIFLCSCGHSIEERATCSSK